jgi:hypothetical protein
LCGWGRWRLRWPRGRLGRRLPDAKEVGHTGEKTTTRFLAGATGSGKLLLEISDTALRRCQCLLHDESALNQQVRSQRLLRDLAANEFIGLGVLWLGRALVQSVEETRDEIAFVRSHEEKEAHPQPVRKRECINAREAVTTLRRCPSVRILEMNATSQDKGTASEPSIEPMARHVCEECGATGAVNVGDRWLCENCYVQAGSCCPEFGASDLWEDACRSKQV